ncbi:hypothetical protein LCGC14_0397280 [marine sediment metagenome]|uniref:Uncharacterized protein n=1 Tax=marine sediment metagenome TaxID=412755 RepID=A0A0F9SY10_9ZZZZ
MQIALLESTVLAISVPKRGLMAFAVKKVLGVPALYDEGATRWYVYSDPSIDIDDVRTLIAVVENIGDFPNTGPPQGFPDVTERRNVGPPQASWVGAANAVRGWAQSRLPPFPPEDHPDFGEALTLEDWFARPWLQINTTEGMVPFVPNDVQP